MIVSASRRTDIPAFYSEWFMNRIREQQACVVNPRNENQISRISLTPSDVDCIVFWTKNATPLENYLDELSANYMYYFQYTLTAYDKDIEPHVPNKEKVIIPNMIRLSEKLGSKRIIWRYDPIMLTSKYTKQKHCEIFEKYASLLSGKIEKVIISFVDFTRQFNRNMKDIDVITDSKYLDKEYTSLMFDFIAIAQKYDFELETCAEISNFTDNQFVKHTCCIDPKLIAEIIPDFNDKLPKKDVGQKLRKACGCCESNDVGAANSCLHGCKYCYATLSHEEAILNYKNLHQPSSNLLKGNLEMHPNAKITDRKIKHFITQK